MLLQAEAGKYGHTLVGTPDDPCATMIFFENSYSLDTRSQLEDRIHRMGAVAESCLYRRPVRLRHRRAHRARAPAQGAHVRGGVRQGAGDGGMTTKPRGMLPLYFILRATERAYWDATDGPLQSEPCR